jgi:hypothetical protein
LSKKCAKNKANTFFPSFAEGAEKNGENRESGIDPCLRQAGFGRLERKAPASLRRITQGRQDDDARRIVRNTKNTEKAEAHGVVES